MKPMDILMKSTGNLLEAGWFVVKRIRPTIQVF